MNEKILAILFRIFKRLLISFLMKQTHILTPVTEFEENGVKKIECSVQLDLGTIVVDEDVADYNILDINVLKQLVKTLI